jgi:hypothetical protein
MNSDRHYYIVNRANGHFLAPCILENKNVGWYGMAAGIDIYQYDQSGSEYQTEDYRQSFKWMIEFVDGNKDLVRFNNKWTGQYLGVTDDSKESGARLTQMKAGSIDWLLKEVEFEGTQAASYQIVNRMTGGSMAVQSAQDGNATFTVQIKSNVFYTPENAWALIEANQFENGSGASGTPTFKLQEDIRDNNWFKLAIPQPADIPYAGATATAKIDAIGKMIGIFPDQNELEELYNTLVEAMKQIIEQALMKNELNNVMGDWNTVHINLNAYKGTKNPQKLLEALEDAGKMYAEITGRLMVEDVKEEGLVLFMQAASEHLASIWSIEILSPGMTGQGYMATAQTYATHLRNTFEEMKEKRLALIIENLIFIYRLEDPYQRTRIVGTRDANLYNTLDEHRQIMGSHFTVEFGDPHSLAQSWMEQPVPALQALA